MYAHASYADDQLPSFIIADTDSDTAGDGFFAGDQVCPPSSGASERVSYTSLFLLLAFAVGCAFATDTDTRHEWTSKIERMAASLMAYEQQQPSVLPAKEISAADTPGSIPLSATTGTTAAAAPVAQPLPEVKVSNAPGDAGDGADGKSPGKSAISEAYAPPQPSSDPLGKKAETAGLHPDLSRAVLSRLTATDYRNAAYAIDKALKTVRNDGEFTWPRTRKPGSAVFTVHFVQGAAHDCRRYVVTITKDRWTSTALPMERCGVKVAFRAAAKEKAIE
jgi:hypothetical protein